MLWQRTPYTIPLIIAALLSITAAYLVWRRRRTLGATPITLLMLAVATWALFYMMELGSLTLPAKIFWAKMEYLAIVTIPVTWLIFTLIYSGRGKWVSRRNIYLLSIIPLITLSLVWTNEVHQWVWSDLWLQTVGEFNVLGLKHGVGFWSYWAYANILLVFSTFLLIQSLIRARHLYRGQVIAILLGALAPWIGNAIYLSGLNPFPHLDLTPFAFTFTGLAMVWGLFRYRFMDLVPIARTAVLESMHEAVIVLDAQNRILDLNPAAKLLVNLPDKEVIGEICSEVFLFSNQILSIDEDPISSQSVLSIDLELDGLHYVLSSTALFDHQRHFTGRLLVLRDITKRVLSEQALAKAHAQLDATLNALPDLMFEVDIHGRFHDFRAPDPELLYTPPEEFIGKTVSQVLPPDAASTIMDALEQTDKTGQHRGAVYSLELPRGLSWFEISIAAKEGGRYITLVRDITDQVNAEQEIQQRNLELSTLYETATIISTDLSLDVVVQTVAEQTAQAINAGGCALSLWNRELDQLETLVDFNAVNPDDVDPPRTIYDLKTHPASKQVLEDQQSMVVYLDDPEADEAEKEWMVAQGVKTLLMVPLVVRDFILGLLELYEDTVAREYTADEIRLIESLTAQAAIAIENARLYDRVEQDLNEREILLQGARRHADEMTAMSSILQALNAVTDVSQAFPVVAKVLQSTSGCERISLALLEEDRQWATFIALDQARPELGQGTRFPLSSTSAAEDVLAGRLHLTPDLATETDYPSEQMLYQAGHRSRINLPLHIGDQVIGALNLTWLQIAGYDEAQLPLLAQIADAVALAVEKTRLFQEVQQLAITDELTGLSNRRVLFDLGEREIQRVKRYNRSLAVVMLDIDHFKKVNDTYGHPVGDKVLQALAKCLILNTRDIDIVGRYGGEEFAILMPEIRKNEVLQAAERLRKQIAQEVVDHESGPISITVSLGVAVAKKENQDLADLFESADNALYTAKKAGRNCVRTALGEEKI